MVKLFLIENFTEELHERGALIGLLWSKWTESETRLRAATKTIAHLRAQLKRLRAEVVRPIRPGDGQRQHRRKPRRGPSPI